MQWGGGHTDQTWEPEANVKDTAALADFLARRAEEDAAVAASNSEAEHPWRLPSGPVEGTRRAGSRTLAAGRRPSQEDEPAED